MNPKYPIYIISKGRWKLRPTSKLLDSLNVPYHICVEPKEYDEYSQFIDKNKIYKLPENFSERGKGSIPVRNWVWKHAISIDSKKHWLMDDNIYSFWRLYNNRKIKVGDGTCLKVMEDFTDRYINVAFSGPENLAFVRKYEKHPPFKINTRIYSCTLIRNDLSYRWRGKYNEDTDLMLRALKDNWCTILFYIFNMDKATTLLMKGGNTDELYSGTNEGDLDNDGRYKMAKSLKEQHPNIVEVKWKWGRWQHHVDYSFFKKNKLKLRKGLTIPKGINNYGMILRKIDD